MGKQPNTKTITQDEDVVFINARVRKSVDRAVEAEAFRLDIPKSRIIEQALIAYLGLKETAA